MRGLVKHTVQQSVLQKIPHTYQRNGIYYFCYRIPKVIRTFYSYPSMIRQSLYTRSASVASSMVNSLVFTINEIKVHCVAKKIQKHITQEFISIPTLLGPVVVDGGKGDIEAEKKEANDIIKAHPHLNDPNYAKLLADIKIKQITNENDSSLRQEIKQIKPSKPTIKEMYQKWQASWDEQGLILKEQDNHRRNMTILMYLYGDQTADSLTAKQADEVLSIAERMPKGNIRPYNEINLTERVKMVINGEVSHNHRVAGFRPVLKTCQGFYSFMSRSYVIDNKPFNDRRIKASEQKERGAFEIAEIQRIIDFSSKQTEAIKKWIPLIMAYTGMRNSEIQGLERSQFKVCADTGLHYMQVGIVSKKTEGGVVDKQGRSKKKASIRKVPIAQDLIDFGLLEYVNLFTNQNERIFPVSEKWLTNYYSGTLKKACKLPNLDSSGDYLTMYSTRHSVTTFLRKQKANEAMTTAIVGHENRNTVHDNYTKISLFPVDTLKTYVDGLPWEIRANYSVTN